MSGAIAGSTRDVRTQPELEKIAGNAVKGDDGASSFASMLGGGGSEASGAPAGGGPAGRLHALLGGAPGAVMVGGELVGGRQNAATQSQGGGDMMSRGSGMSDGLKGAAGAAMHDMNPMTATGVLHGIGAMKDPDSTASRLVHTGLDVGGMMPGLGTVTEGAKTALNALQGQQGNAALSGASALPGLGDVADAGRLGENVPGLTKTA